MMQQVQQPLTTDEKPELLLKLNDVLSYLMIWNIENGEVRSPSKKFSLAAYSNHFQNKRRRKKGDTTKVWIPEIRRWRKKRGGTQEGKKQSLWNNKTKSERQKRRWDELQEGKRHSSSSLISRREDEDTTEGEGQRRRGEGEARRWGEMKKKRRMEEEKNLRTAAFKRQRDQMKWKERGLSLRKDRRKTETSFLCDFQEDKREEEKGREERWTKVRGSTVKTFVLLFPK